MVRKLNAIVRFSIYYAIIVYLYNRNINVLGVPIIVASCNLFYL